MKSEWRKICSMVLAGIMTTVFVTGVPVMEEVSAAESQPFITEIPGTVKTEKDLDGSFLSVSGFAKGNVNDRSQYSEGDSEYAVVTDEIEFFDALYEAESGNVKVIEIRADLRLGWNELSEDIKAMYEGELVEPYFGSQDSSRVPVGNPVLVETGISTVTIHNVDGLTIFSTMGNSLKHAEFKFNSGVNDVIIRNLEFTEVWEWDDWRTTGYGMYGGKGNRKRTGWTNIKLNGCKNVWIDHCTFGNSFDGNIDVENGSNGITISWCKIGDDDVSVGSIHYKTAMYLETLYQQSKTNSEVASFVIYEVMRDNGLTPQQIMKFMSQHDKVHLCGAGDRDSWLFDKANNQFLDEPNYEKEDANEKIRLSLGYNSYSDIGQRLPMVRSGIGHVYNCYVNDWDLAEINTILNSRPNNGAQGTYRSLIGGAGGTCVTSTNGIDARDGASIAADTCVYYGAKTAINGTAYHPNGSNIQEGFQNTWKYNYALVVNSSFQAYGSDEVYVGSSWDNNGKNPFIDDEDYWKVGSGEETNSKAAEAIIGNWKWRQEGVNAMPGESTTELPYSYQTFPLETVKENTEKYSGFRKVEMSAEEWLKVDYDASFEIKAVDSSVEIPIESIEMTKSEATLFIEEEFLQLEADAFPYNTTETEDTYKWTSSNPEVATVNECGLVIPVSNGTAKITVTTEKGLMTSCNVTVTNLPAKVEVSNIPETIYVGDTIVLDATVTPEEILDNAVVWQNNGVNMQMIDAENGIFKALKAGKNPVQATTVLKGNRVGSNEGTFVIKNLQIVEPDVYTTAVEVEKTAIIKPGESVQLNAKVLPENATNKNVTWKAADETIATVNENGFVTAVSEGATTITVTSVNGGFEAACEVIVTNELVPMPPEDTSGGAVTPNPGTGGAVEPDETVKVMRGDVDGNKKVDLTDAQLALKMALKIIATPTEEQSAAADVDDNSKIDLTDAQKILKVALRIESFEE